MSLTIPCCAVIPCFNEEQSVGGVVRQVKHLVKTVIVVDDGSTDHTLDVSGAEGATVVSHDVNRGKGAAVRTGLQTAVNLGCEFAVLMDGDGQHDPADVPAFLAQITPGGPDLVIGNRMDAAESMPWLRRRVNRWMSRRLSLLTGQSFPDTQCGFRLIRLSAWRQLAITADRFEVESDMLLAFVKAGFRVAFVPIATVYKAERSKIHPVQDTLRWLRWWRNARRSFKQIPVASNTVRVAQPKTPGAMNSGR